MTIRPVLQVPHPALRTPCRPVGTLDRETVAVMADLIDTMRASPACVGLAANQIGADVRALVVDVTGHRKARSCHGLIALFDPQIIDAGEVAMAREGCMSVPDLTGDVPRAQRLVVAGLDNDGQRIVVDVDAFEARALLHEIDHLDGHVFLDRVVASTGIFPRKVYRRA
jgi:peptide deformylase